MSPQARERIAFWLLRAALVVVLFPVLFIVAYMVMKGAPGLSWEFLTTAPRSGMRAGGIFPAIVGTLCLVAGMLIVALPLGVCAAIYLSEYARPSRWTRFIRLAIVNLSGVPSVVYGLFGLGCFVLLLQFGTSILAGALTLAIEGLAVIITASEEALRSVPQSFRQVAYSLGATRWQVVRTAVMPYALPGMLTGTILALSRAAGETAPILFTVAAFYLPRLPQSVFDPVMALPYHLYVLSTQIPNVPSSITYGTALVLVGVVVLFNITAILIRARFRRRRQW